MAKNPHHRILALTATPGGRPEVTQTIVDALHISRIEIRNEESMDLKPYMFEKV
jgi:ATP-dependent DNA helicase MPH1